MQPQRTDSPERKEPVRPKGFKTRARLRAAAEQIFERDGYRDARVADIAAEAGVAHGTFYTYFQSKEDIFRDLVESVVEDVARALRTSGEGSTEDRIRSANRRYLELYERHAAMLGLIEQVGTFQEFKEMRRELRYRFTERIERAIRRLQQEGETAAQPLDPHVMANILGGMTDNFAYTWFFLKEPFDRESALANLDAAWLRVLGVPDGLGEDGG